MYYKVLESKGTFLYKWLTRIPENSSLTAVCLEPFILSGRLSFYCHVLGSQDMDTEKSVRCIGLIKRLLWERPVQIWGFKAEQGRRRSQSKLASDKTYRG
jgi:hypothetical protein